MARRSFQAGEFVVIRVWKRTKRPGARAQSVRPCSKGDTYVYFIEKVWRILEVMADGQLLLQTRRGKTHLIAAGDPNLRRLTIADRFRHRSRISVHKVGSGQH